MGEETKKIIDINYKWCKGCGICYELCPKKVLGKDAMGKVIINDEKACTKCRICEEHCPDYCIKIGG